jgi:hypothetical protein
LNQEQPIAKGSVPSAGLVRLIGALESSARAVADGLPYSELLGRTRALLDRHERERFSDSVQLDLALMLLFLAASGSAPVSSPDKENLAEVLTFLVTCPICKEPVDPNNHCVPEYVIPHAILSVKMEDGLRRGHADIALGNPNAEELLNGYHCDRVSYIVAPAEQLPQPE